MTVKGGKGEQLAMFMPAGELHDTHSIDVEQKPGARFGGAWPDMRSMWNTKSRENRIDKLDKDVAANGVRRPVTLATHRDVDGWVILDGHHRIQAAFEINPRMEIPVQHEDINDKPGYR